jgi:copper ion binding protein
MKFIYWNLTILLVANSFLFPLSVGRFAYPTDLLPVHLLKAKEIKLEISGMSCFRCAEKIEKKIGRMEGVSEIKVNLEEKNANIKFDDSKISVQQIKDKVKEIGYEPGAYIFI